MTSVSVESSVAEIAELAASAASLDEVRRGSLEILARSIGFDFGVVWRIDAPVTPTSGTIVGFSQTHWATYCRDASRYDAELEPLLARASAGVVDDATVFGRRRERLAFYDEIIRPVGSREYLTGIMRVAARPIGVIQIGRGVGASSAFTAEQASALTRMLPVLSLGEAVRMRAGEPRRSPSVALTQREHQLIEHARLGHTIAEIALALGTSPHTVRNQFAKLYRKLGVSSRAELVGLTIAV